MLDLETMGTASNSAIIAIGACYFDTVTGELGDEFYREVNLKSANDCGGVIDPSTVIWWMNQSDDARNKFAKNNKAGHIMTVLAELSTWFKDGSIVWGNGSSFDNTILRNAYERSSLNAPWEFWNDRDVRTIVDLGLSVGVRRDQFIFDGVAHYALDDAKHQVKYVSAIHRKLLMMGRD